MCRATHELLLQVNSRPEATEPAETHDTDAGAQRVGLLHRVGRDDDRPAGALLRLRTQRPAGERSASHPLGSHPMRPPADCTLMMLQSWRRVSGSRPVVG